MTYPTEDAYLRACRVGHWLRAQLRAHGIEPVAIPNGASQYPPDYLDFGATGTRSDRDVAIGEHAFDAGFRAAITIVAAGASPVVNEARLRRAWSDYTPPDDLS